MRGRVRNFDRLALASAATCSTAVHPYNDMPSPAASLSSLAAVAPCSHCFAKRFHGETLGFCCSKGLQSENSIIEEKKNPNVDDKLVSEKQKEHVMLLSEKKKAPKKVKRTIAFSDDEDEPS